MLATRMRASANQRPLLIDVLTELGLTTGLKVCVDAIDPNSAGDSSEYFDDVSGNIGGGRIRLGSTTEADVNDPVFNSGGWFDFSGSQYCQYTGGNELWMDNIQKNGMKLSYLFAIFGPASWSATSGLFSNGDGNTNGCNIGITSAGRPYFFTRRGGVDGYNGRTSSRPTGDNALATSAWNICGMSLDENGGSVSFFYLNGDYNPEDTNNLWDGNFTAGSDVGGQNTPTWFSLHDGAGNPTFHLPNGTRAAFGAQWDGVALTKDNFDGIFARMRAAFGL